MRRSAAFRLFLYSLFYREYYWSIYQNIKSGGPDHIRQKQRVNPFFCPGSQREYCLCPNNGGFSSDPEPKFNQAPGHCGFLPDWAIKKATPLNNNASKTLVISFALSAISGYPIALGI